MAIQVVLVNIDHSILRRFHDGSAPEGNVMFSPRYPETSRNDLATAAVFTPCTIVKKTQKKHLVQLHVVSQG